MTAILPRICSLFLNSTSARKGSAMAACPEMLQDRAQIRRQAGDRIKRFTKQKSACSSVQDRIGWQNAANFKIGGQAQDCRHFSHNGGSGT
jgi:hypothetical protein